MWISPVFIKRSAHHHCYRFILICAWFSLVLKPSTFINANDLNWNNMCPNFYTDHHAENYTLTKAELKSKYLYPSKLFQAKDIKQICERTQQNDGIKLELASVHDMREFRHLVTDLIEDKKFVEMRENGTAVINVMVSGNATNPTFHFFNLRNGTYFETGKDCLEIECSGDHKCFYKPSQCIQPGNVSLEQVPLSIPVCQYPETWVCYKLNVLVLDYSWRPMLRQIGKTEWATYYGSRVQKSWEQAKAECQKEKMVLLGFGKQHQRDNGLAVETIALFYSEAKGPNNWTQAVWTSGKFKTEFGEDKEFQFDGSDEVWQYKDNMNHWEWADKSLVKNPQKEKCLAIVDTCPTVLRSISCDLPNYFVCVREDQKHEHPNNNNNGGGSGGRLFPDIVPDAGNFQPGNIPNPTQSFIKPELECHEPHPSHEVHCSTNDGSVCQCRRDPLCVYNGASQRCEDENYYCERKFTFSGLEASPNGSYIIGGTICNHFTDQPDPNPKGRKIMAVNLNGEKTTDSSNLTYEAGRDVSYRDPYKILRLDEADKKWNSRGISEADSKLYRSFILGTRKSGMRPNLDMCIIYDIPAEDKGLFLLTLKFADITEKSSFNIKFNNVRVLWEADLARFGDKKRSAVDLLLNYQIMPDRKTLILKGQPDTIVTRQKIPLALCHSECKNDPDFTSFKLSAFSVLEYAENETTGAQMQGRNEESRKSERKRKRGRKSGKRSKSEKGKDKEVYQSSGGAGGGKDSSSEESSDEEKEKKKDKTTKKPKKTQQEIDDERQKKDEKNWKGMKIGPLYLEI